MDQQDQELSASPNEACDPRLDFTSSEFDAELALRTPQLQPPVAHAPVLDNVSRCAGFLATSQEEEVHQQEPTKETEEAKAKKAKAAALKHRALQTTQRAEASVKLGSLNEMMTLAAVGPLAVLASWHAAGQRVYVITRHASGVRGRAVGTLAGFDKFMNLLLKDVEETYTVIAKVQRVKQLEASTQQVQQQQQQQQQTVENSQQVQQQQQQKPSVEGESSSRPPCTRTRWCRKQQHRFRQLDQVLLKGDNIVLIASAPPALQLPPGRGPGAGRSAEAVPPAL